MPSFVFHLIGDLPAFVFHQMIVGFEIRSWELAVAVCTGLNDRLRMLRVRWRSEWLNVGTRVLL